MSTIYKLGPNQNHTLQLDVDQMACRVRLSIDGRVELDKQVLDRLVYAFRLAGDQRLPVRLVAELAGWRIEAGLFVGSKQVAPVNGQLAAVSVPVDPNAQNEPIGAGTEEAAKAAPATAPAVTGPDGPTGVAPVDETPVAESSEADDDTAADADDGLRATPAEELPVLGRQPGDPEPPPTPLPAPTAFDPLAAGVVLAGGGSPATAVNAKRRKTDLTNPGILACMAMAVLNLIALMLARMTQFGHPASGLYTVERWMEIAVVGSGLTFLVLAFGVALRSLFATWCAILLTLVHLAASLTVIIWLAVLMIQKDTLDLYPLAVIGGLLIRDTICLVLLATGRNRLRRWWA